MATVIITIDRRLSPTSFCIGSRKMKRVFLTLVVLSFSVNSVEAQLYQYKENGKLIVEFGNVTGLLNRSQAGPILKNSTIKTNVLSGITGGTNIFVRLENGKMSSKHYIPNWDGRAITWERGVGPTQLGWQGQGYYPTTIKIYSDKKPQTLIIEKTASGFELYLDINGVRKKTTPSYVSEQFKSAAKELTRIKQLYKRHNQELTAVLKLRKALIEDIPRTGELSFALIAAKSDYTTTELNATFSMLIQRSSALDGSDRISVSDFINLKSSRIKPKALLEHINDVLYGN